MKSFLSTLFNSYKKVIDEGKEDITDDSMVVEYASDTQIKMIMGSYNNIKITTPEDLSVAEVYLEK